MMLRYCVASCLSLLAITCQASSTKAVESDTLASPSNRIGVQAAIATGGNLGFGVVKFTENAEFGLTASGKVNNASEQTKTITPVVFAGLRKHLGQDSEFAYGIDISSTFGRDHGETINKEYGIGPYIGLEKMMTNHIMLVGWIEPYSYHYEKIGGQSTSTNNFFNAGGVGLNYLF